MIPQGSPHKEIEALIVAIAEARWRFKTVGSESEIFSRSGTITSLVSRLEKGMQTRWYLYLTKDSWKIKEEALIQDAAGKIWRQQRMIAAWCNAERAHQHNNKVSELINNQECRK